MRNLPVPDGPRAPVNARWLVKHGPYAAVIAVYRLIPPQWRKGWNAGVSTSHDAMAAVLAPDGGRKAFGHYTRPQLATKRQHGYALAWTLFLLSLVLPGLSIAKKQSWAN